MLVNRLQNYQARKSHLVALLTVLLTLLLTSLAILIIECLDLQNTYHAIAEIKSYDLWSLPCSPYCRTLATEINGECCSRQSGACESKERCYESAVQQLEFQVQTDVYGVTYSAGPAVLFLLFFVVIAIQFYRLRKAAQQELFQQQQQHQEQPFLQNYAIQEVEYEIDEDSFQTEEQFIQFLIDAGYVLPAVMAAPRRRGDPKITDSFGTVDNQPCPICMMQLSEEKVLQLVCSHRFHSSCIRDWNETNPSCPVCRADVYPE